jgi:hypothetical protein
VYSQSDVCNQETIFRTFHNEDTEADVDPIKARQRGDGDGLAFRLFNVVKGLSTKRSQSVTVVNVFGWALPVHRFRHNNYRTRPRELSLSRLNSARQSMSWDKVWKQMVSSMKPIALVKSHHQCHSLRIQVAWLKQFARSRDSWNCLTMTNDN